MTFSFLPADIVSQILNFGLPAPIDIQIVGFNVPQTGLLPTNCWSGSSRFAGLSICTFSSLSISLICISMSIAPRLSRSALPSAMLPQTCWFR